MGKYAIETRDLEYRYEDGTKALDGVNFCAEAGKITGILGANGAGKSTLFLNLNGVLTPASGQVMLNGEAVRYNRQGIAQLRKEVGIVFQDPDNQLFSADVYRDISFGPVNLGLSTQEVRQRVEWAMEQTGVTQLRDKPTHALSYGQKKRVAIAGVLAMEPDVIIADEATAMLDPSGRKEVLKTVRRLNKTKGITVMWITHFMEEAAQADRVVVISGGQVVRDGKPGEVFEHIDEMRDLHLDVPPMTDMAHQLRTAGMPLPEGILTVETMAEEVAKVVCRSK